MGLRARLVAVVVAAVAFAATWTAAYAQSSGGPTTTTTPSTGIAVKNGGTVTVAVPYLPSEYNPEAPSGENSVTQMVMAQVWPQPFVVNGSLQAQVSTDSHGQPGLLASSGAELTSVHPETVVYNINPDAKWSDGVPITATDFIYNWREQLKVGPTLAATDPLLGYEDIKSIVGSNKGKTVTVTFSKPYADWEALFSDLVPAHIASRYGWASAFASFDPAKVISGGPFVITKVIPGKELVLSRNHSYWGNPPALDRIIFRVFPSDAAVIRGLQRGSISVAQLAPSAALNNLEATSTTLSFQSALSPTMWQLGFNLANPAVASVNVRQAIASAIDRQQLVSNTIGFLTPFSSTSGNRVYASGAPGSQGNDGTYAQADVTETDRLLEAVSDTVANDGHVESPDGKALTFSLVGPTGSTVASEVEAELQAQFLEAGMELRIHNVAPSTLFNSILPSGGYEIALAPFVVSAFPSTTMSLYSDPVGPTPDYSSFTAVQPIVTGTSIAPAAHLPTFIATHISGSGDEPDTQAVGAVTRDVFGFDDPVVTALYQQATEQLNASAASGLYNQIDVDMWQDMPTLPLFQMPDVLVTKRVIVNVRDTQTLVGAMWDAQDWAIRILPPTSTTTSTP